VRLDDGINLEHFSFRFRFEFETEIEIENEIDGELPGVSIVDAREVVQRTETNRGAVQWPT
jgi:hypothetical protein